LGADRIQTVVAVEVLPESGSPWIGSGFLVRYSSGGRSYDFLATARHVIAGEKAIGKNLRFFLNRTLNDFDLKAGQSNIVSHDVLLSTYSANKNVGFPSHPQIDVAVVFLGIRQSSDEDMAEKAKSYSAPASTQSAVLIANPSLLLPNLIGPIPAADTIQEIFFAGYPFGVNQQRWMHPILRSGVIASADTQGYVQANFGPDAFLIDRAPIPGDSGGPIFSRDFEYGDGRLLNTRSSLVGIISREITIDEAFVSEARYSKLAELRKTRLELGVAYPAKYLMEAIADVVKIH